MEVEHKRERDMEVEHKRDMEVEHKRERYGGRT